MADLMNSMNDDINLMSPTTTTPSASAALNSSNCHHQLKVEKEREMFLEKLRKKKEEDKKKYDSIMSELSNLTLDEKKLDKEFQEELAKQRKSKESNATSLSGLEEFKKYYAKIEHYKVAFKPKMDDAAFSKAWFIKKKGIKRTISQLTSNHEFIFTKYKEIYALLMNIKQESNDAFEVTLNYLSKEILRQVEVDVSNKPYCAYIFARFTYMICSSIPEFTDYLLGRLYKRCPYIVPQFHDDDPTLSKKEMQKRLRYTYSDKQEKVGETFLLHAERNKGFIMFYVALCSTIPDPGHPQNPFSIKSVWIYLARLLNMSLRPISPFLVGGVLNIAGKGLLDNYPNQAPKLFRLLQDTVLPLMLAERTNDSNSAIISVGNFLSTYFEKGVAEIISETPPESQNIVKKNFY
ncbi:hypothetical protein INT48_006016 [Thamnidium elegans]|uniref:mRNA export factor GLE1 n=1 Tax=Thamnidium elegans TaxID=101142 RepID=A0A8H7VMZ7_9FUNG|nr:hypothetical protein INT48_006016 [Thamnidium elegans]